MNEKIDVRDILSQSYETKRSFRWIIDVPGIPPFLVSMVNCGADESGSSMYIEYMSELGKTSSIERPSDKSGNGTLKMLDVDGTIVEELWFSYDGYDFMPYVFLDYTSVAAARRAVTLKKVIYHL